MTHQILQDQRQYKIIIYDKTYTKYQLFDTITNVPCDTPIQPIQEKRFSEDIVSENGTLLFSKIRSMDAIPGILVLENNRTYGRTENKKRLFYRCILYDPTLPDFIVAYSPASPEFSKNPKNMFILFKFDQWTNKHPEGVIIKSIGDVDNLQAYYEYRLYCKCLVQTNGKLNQYIYKTSSLTSPEPSTAPTTTRHIFTIDPQNTTVYDDALELSYKDNDPQIAIVSVHISDVARTIEHTKPLWDKLAENIKIPASIYMPDKRHSLLPPLLEQTCSLTKKNTPTTPTPHRVITTTFHIDTKTNQIIYTDIQPTIIEISVNYVYESPELFRDPQYITLYDLTHNLAGVSTIETPTHPPPPSDSIELVEFWMLKTNALIAKILKSHHSGIFRTVKQVFLDENQDRVERPLDNHRHQQEWNTYHRGKYQLYDPDKTDLSHAALHLPEYIHITSPIRRLVDILNQITLYDTAFRSFHTLSENSLNFLQKWANVSEMDRINQQMQDIQKIQTECFLLSQFSENPEMLKRPYRGTVVECSENKCTHTYTIYLYDFRLFCSVKQVDVSWSIGSEHDFKIFVFKDENTFHKKIRIMKI